MALEDKIPLRPTVRKIIGSGYIPLNRGKFTDYMKSRDSVAKYLEANPEHESLLKKIVDDTFERPEYKEHLHRPIGASAEKVFDWLGLAGDAYFFFNPIGGLGIKLISTIGKAGSDWDVVKYSIDTGDYLAIPELILLKAASYVPGLNELVDSSLTGLIKRRMANHVENSFLNQVGTYESPLEKMSQIYAGVRDRSANIFHPKQFEPAYQAS